MAAGIASIIMVLHAAAALAYAALTALILLQIRRNGSAFALAGACAVTAIWAAAVASNHPALAAGLDLVRAMAWYGFVLLLYRRAVPSGGELGRIFATMGMVAVLVVGATLPLGRIAEPHFFADLLDHVRNGTGWPPGMTPLSFPVAARIGLAVCNLLLLENLYFNTPPEERRRVSLPCVALGSLFVYDIVLSADTVLGQLASPALFAGRAAAMVIVAPLLALAAARNRQWEIDIHVSRTAAFQSVTLIASGGFLIAVAGLGAAFKALGTTWGAADWGAVAEVGVVFAGFVAVGVLVTSANTRARVRALVSEHFFSNRYDYRREWQRCIDTLSAAESWAPLHLRAIRAAAQVVDSPGGALFVREPGEAAYQWAGSWNMPGEVQAVPPEHPVLAAFGTTGQVVKVSPGLLEGALADAWLAVPLGDAARPAASSPLGFLLLAPSRISFRLDNEVFELLRMIGREIAVHIAEQQAVAVLGEARQLHEYGRRFAFVAHDVKNVSSQLSLLLANAEVHLENPEFQRDMLATVRASVTKISALLRRLQVPGDGPKAEIARNVIAPAERLEALLEASRRIRGIGIDFDHDGQDAPVAMDGPAFDAVVTHILNNAIEASGAGGQVRVAMHHEARRLLIDITDNGPGMTPEFVRDRLFRPFQTSKRKGSGIGAFQARALLREAGGDLLVISRAGIGTTMRLLLPLLEPAGGNTAKLSA